MLLRKIECSKRLQNALKPFLSCGRILDNNLLAEIKRTIVDVLHNARYEGLIPDRILDSDFIVEVKRDDDSNVVDIVLPPKFIEWLENEED